MNPNNYCPICGRGYGKESILCHECPKKRLAEMDAADRRAWHEAETIWDEEFTFTDRLDQGFAMIDAAGDQEKSTLWHWDGWVYG